MSGLRVHGQPPSLPRLRLWWLRATWVIPTIGTLLGAAAAGVVVVADDVLYFVDPADRRSLAAGSATTILAAIGGGMVTFTGFVFSFVLLIMQYGSATYSPRTVAHFLRARSVQVILGLFLATITFSFLTALTVGSAGRSDFVPSIAVFVAVVLLVASLLGFVVLQHTIGRRMRVDAVLATIGADARSQLRRRLPAHSARSMPQSSGDPPATVHYEGSQGQVIAVDAARLRRLADRRSYEIALLVRVGDSIVPGTPVAAVRGADDRAGASLRISRALVVDVERSLVHDPRYSLRLLVDVAIRALSPAVNDPTTAVRALDEIEAVLRTAAPKELGDLVLPAGKGRVVLAGASWEEFVDLALLEIADCGREQVQVNRRLVALLEDLLDDVPDQRRGILQSYLDQVRANVAQQSGRSRAVGALGDRQGLGGSASARRGGISPGP